jgi:glycosyltransferase involved in cell wall biosynthesis
MLFSILIPSYNRPQYIDECIRSCLTNSGSDVEIIVGDDASPLHIEIQSILKPYINHNNVRFIQNQKNLGWSKTRNLLIENANGEWVILLGDDDRLKSGALSCLRKWVQKSPSDNLYAFGYDVIDEEGCYVYSRRGCREKKYSVQSKSDWKELFYYDALPMWSHHPFSLCCKKRIAEKLRYDGNAGIADDVHFLLRFLASGESLSVIPESLIEWRRPITKKTGYTSLSDNTLSNRRSMIRVYALLLNDSNISPMIQDFIRNRVFIGRFLGITAMDAARVEELVTLGLFDDANKAMEDAVSATTSTSYFSKAAKIIRVCRILGLCHIANIVKYYIDMMHYSKNHST